MEKKNRPLQAANSDIRTSDITPTTSPVQVPRRTPKKHRARVYMLRTGINGYSGEPRDHMNAEQLEHLSYLESTNITLIDMGMEYEQRKGELTRLSQRWLAKRLEVNHA